MHCLNNIIRLTLALWSMAVLSSSLTGCTPIRAKPDYDPLEPLNRKIFWFNEQADTYAIEPAAKAWDYILPDAVQDGLERFLTNSAVPVRLVNSLLQAKWRAGSIVLSRFVINTVAGVGGVFDPASTMGLERQIEDTGQTFGRWGIPAGPYVVIPLLGPSSVRDAVGLVADGWLLVWPYFAPFYVTLPVGAVTSLNLRSLALEDVREARATALDFYTFVRNAYIQRRNAQILDTTEQTEKRQKDLYDYDLDPEYDLQDSEE